MGGVVNIVASLASYRGADVLPQHVVLTHNTLNTDTRSDWPATAPPAMPFEYTLPVENLHAVLSRLAEVVPADGGVLVSNDLLELAMLHRHDPGRMVVQILHGDHPYYYELAAKHDAVIDVFVAYSRAMFETLCERLPHRAADVYYLPYGVPPAPRLREPASGPLRLLFAGRIEHGQKGVFDLPEIDRELMHRGVACQWTLIGDGPDVEHLRRSWLGSHIDWRGAMPRAQLLHAFGEFDVFVLPTRTEGFPVALVEAMAAGLVPVVSDIRSGVPEIVDSGVNGFRMAVGNTGKFADAIQQIDADRALLESMSHAARASVTAKFDEQERCAAYHALFARWRELRRPRSASLPMPYGSRLDQPWIPNAVVRQIRSVVRRRQGKPS